MRYRIHEFELDVEGGQLIGPTGVVPLRRQVLLQGASRRDILADAFVMADPVKNP